MKTNSKAPTLRFKSFLSYSALLRSEFYNPYHEFTIATLLVPFVFYSSNSKLY